MPGQYQLSLDRLGEAVAEVAELGIPAIILFGIPEHKDARGSAALRDDGHRPARRSGSPSGRRRAAGDHRPLLLRVHRSRPLRPLDGIGRPDRTSTTMRRLPLLAEQAVSHARAGADVIAPSGMMDGMVAGDPPRAGRGRLHRACRSCPTRPSSPAAITARSARPPRARPRFGDRRTLPDGPGQRRRGAPRGRARPGRRGRHRHGQARAGLSRHHPAGQGARSACRWPPTTSRASTPWSRRPPRSGWIDERRIVLETLTGIKRAGADMILTYHAPDVARWLRQG